IKAVGKNGGLISLNFYSGFLDSTYNKKQKAFFAKYDYELKQLSAKYGRSNAIDSLIALHPKDADATRPSIELLVDHIDYIVKLIGINHVGLGADFDGAESFPLGINSIADYPKVTEILLKRGYNEADVKKILGENFLRVLKANKG
ncbi:MAG: membrane dipeptidase, partial [Pedobacter sp.]